MARVPSEKMQISANQLSPVLLELNVEIGADRVRLELDKAYNQLSRGAKVRGFRPGKAPRRVLQQMYGARVAQDVAQRLVDETYPKAVDEQKVQVVSQPAIESEQVTENGAFNYKARVEVLPAIDSVTYTGFAVKRPSVEVEDEQIDEQLKLLQRANSTLEPAGETHEAVDGDVTTIDLKISVDGKEIEDARASNLDLELGGANLLPELQAALVGQKLPFESDVEVDVPATSSHPDLRGKKAIFSIVLRDLKTRVLPELDDEFAKDVGDFENLDGLRSSITEDLKKRREEAADNTVAQALVAELVKANPVEVPPSLVQQQIRVTEQELLTQSQRQGAGNQLSTELRQRVQQDSEVKVRAGLLMAEIAKGQGIKVQDEDLEEGLKELAEQSGKSLPKLKAEYRDRQKREMLVGMILENKVLDIIESEAQIEQE